MGRLCGRSSDKPWERDTIVNVFSCSKNVASLAILILVDRGVIDVNERVSHYWPEFAANAKQDILVRHILAHTSGLAGWEDKMTHEDTYDSRLATERPASQAPFWTPGSAQGYHSLTYGHLLGELVLRSTGKTMKEFIAEEIAGPLGADFQIGAMEKDWPRVSDVIPPPDFATTLRIKSDNGLLEKVVTNPILDPWLANTAEWRRADLSAANGHGNSRSLARMLSLISLGGKLTGCERLLSEKTIDLIFEEQANGIDLVIGASLRRGLGYGLAPTVIMNWLPEGRICYWLGLGGSFVVMDLDRRMTIAYAMNKMAENGAANERLEEYGEAIYEALAGAD